MPLLTDQLHILIGLIAFHDWPDEWPDFIPQIFTILDSSPETPKIRVCHILAKFLSYLNSSTDITLKRRTQTVVQFIEQIPDWFLRFIPDTEELSRAYLEFALKFSLLLGNEDSLVDQFAPFLFSAFAIHDEFACIAVQALRNMFSSTRFLSTLVHPLAIFVGEREADQHTIIPAVHEFICDLLDHAAFAFSVLALDHTTRHDILILLKATLVHHPRDTFVELFWVLWKKVLTRPNPDLVFPLLDDLVANLFDLLASCLWMSRLISPLTSVVYRSLYEIAPEFVIGFLSQQEISHSLCVAVGILTHAGLRDLLPVILQFEATDLSMLSSVLFCVSRNVAFLAEQDNFFRVIQAIVAQFLFEGLDHQTTVLLALNHLVSQIPRCLYTSGLPFITFLFEVTDPMRLDSSNFSRICRILSKIVCSAPADLRDSLTNRLTGLTATFLESSDYVQIELGAQIAWSIGSLSACGCCLVAQRLWQPLLSAMSTTKGDELFSTVAAVFPSALRTARWGQCRKICSRFLKLAATVEFQDAAIVDAYNQIVQCHVEFADTRDEVAFRFVHRLLPGAPPCFFEFFAVCGLRPEEEAAVVPAAAAALANLDLAVSKAAARLLQAVVRKRKDAAFLAQWQPVVVQAVFEALLDRAHVAVFKALGKVVFAIYEKWLASPTEFPPVGPHVAGAIGDAVGDPEISAQFAASLGDAANSRAEFLQMIGDFLVSSGRANPSEMRLFVDTLEVTSLARHILEADISAACIVNEDEFGAQLS
jgi:hypothetical protein